MSEHELPHSVGIQPAAHGHSGAASVPARRKARGDCPASPICRTCMFDRDDAVTPSPAARTLNVTARSPAELPQCWIGLLATFPGPSTAVAQTAGSGTNSTLSPTAEQSGPMIDYRLGESRRTAVGAD